MKRYRITYENPQDGSVQVIERSFAETEFMSALRQAYEYGYDLSGGGVYRVVLCSP